MTRLALDEHLLDRLSSGEQTGRACRKLAPAIAGQSSWPLHQHECSQCKKARMKCFNRLARKLQSCAGCRMSRPHNRPDFRFSERAYVLRDRARGCVKTHGPVPGGVTPLRHTPHCPLNGRRRKQSTKKESKTQPQPRNTKGAASCF